MILITGGNGQLEGTDCGHLLDEQRKLDYGGHRCQRVDITDEKATLGVYHKNASLL